MRTTKRTHEYADRAGPMPTSKLRNRTQSRLRSGRPVERHQRNRKNEPIFNVAQETSPGVTDEITKTNPISRLGAHHQWIKRQSHTNRKRERGIPHVISSATPVPSLTLRVSMWNDRAAPVDQRLPTFVVAFNGNSRENEPIFNVVEETSPGVSGEMAKTNPFSMLARAPF
jgi:hypothetical protein